jgi:hypothetical protein
MEYGDKRQHTAHTYSDASEEPDGQHSIGGGPSGISGAEQSDQAVCRVGVRIPPFWPEEPEVWFAQVESQFVLSNITADITKFHFVSGQLDQEYARIVKDVIIAPPSTQKYEKLKSELIKRISFSREKKTLQLMQHEELGDRKPSQFLRHLRSLAGPKIPDDFLRTIWTSRLPPNVQSIVASQPKSDLDDVADLADRVNDIAVSPGQVASVTAGAQTSSTSSLESKVAELTRQIEVLSMQVNRSRNQYNSRQRSHSRSNSRHRSQSRERPEGHPFCWFHYRFGKKARNCNQPCTFKTGNQQGSH